MYGRDGLNRLNNFQRGELNAGHTSITTLEFEQDWTLDQVANWTGFNQDDDGAGGNDLEQSRTHNKSNEITDINNTTGSAWVDPTYDSAGNTTKAPSPMNPTVTRGDQSYTYDAWNRLVEVVADALTLAEYAYDARGFRVQKKEFDAGSHDATRDYYYTSSWQCIEERITDIATSTTTLDRQYIWGLRYVDDLVRRDRDTTGNGTLDEKLYALNDRQFNVVALWEADITPGVGIIRERMAYDPYGDPQFLNENFTTKSASSYNWNTLFQGLHRDEESGLYYNRARMLHALLGRFLQRDPLGYPDGLNAYAAYHVMRAGLDASGKEEWDIDSVQCEVTVTYSFNFNFEDGVNPDTGEILTWSNARARIFVSSVERQIKEAWDLPQFKIYGDGCDCGCGRSGYAIRVRLLTAIHWIDTRPSDREGFIEFFTVLDTRPDDWNSDGTITGVANDGSFFFRSGAHAGGGARLSESIVSPPAGLIDPATGDFQRTTQNTAAHEFGHILGLNHPGFGIEGIVANDPEEYRYNGNDIHGRPVGAQDLMGTGNNMRPFYFDKWKDQLESENPHCQWEIRKNP